MIKVLALSDNYRSIKADLCNIEETMRDHVDQKDSHLVCSQTYDMNMKQTFSSLPIHSLSLNYEHNPLLQQMSCHVILKSHHARQSYELDITGFYCSL